MSTVAKALNAAIIKAMLPDFLQCRGLLSNKSIDDLFADSSQSGVWGYSAGWGSTGAPENYGFVIQAGLKKGADDFVLQVFVAYTSSAPVILWRVKDVNKVFGWWKVTGTSVLSGGGKILHVLRKRAERRCAV